MLTLPVLPPLGFCDGDSAVTRSRFGASLHFGERAGSAPVKNWCDEFVFLASFNRRARRHFVYFLAP